jgi:hypothetical protein
MIYIFEWEHIDNKPLMLWKVFKLKEKYPMLWSYRTIGGIKYKVWNFVDKNRTAYR